MHSYVSFPISNLSNFFSNLIHFESLSLFLNQGHKEVIYFNGLFKEPVFERLYLLLSISMMSALIFINLFFIHLLLLFFKKFVVSFFIINLSLIMQPCEAINFPL